MRAHPRFLEERAEPTDVTAVPGDLGALPRGRRRRDARRLRLLVLTPVRPASTSTGEDRLTVAVLPSVVPAGVAGIAITVAGTNFHPGGGDDGADEPAIVCVFAGVEGLSAIVPAPRRRRGRLVRRPVQPLALGVRQRRPERERGRGCLFFRGGAGGEVLAFTAPGALRSVVGSRTWARGDAARTSRARTAPRDALGRAAAGDAFPCGWRALDGEYGESPGAYVSSAVRTCETSPRFPSDAGATRRGMHHEPATVWVVATLDAAHPLRPKPKNEGESESGPNAGAGDAETEARPAAAFGAASLSLALAEPPAVTRAFFRTLSRPREGQPWRSPRAARSGTKTSPWHLEAPGRG